MTVFLKLVPILAVFCSSSAFAAEVSDQAVFGADAGDGARQRVEIFTLNVPTDYFTEEEQLALRADAGRQVKYDIWPGSEESMRSWGQDAVLTFQDGKLKTRNSENKTYPLLDQTRPFAIASAHLAFDDRAQLKRGLYKIGGYVDLAGEQASAEVTYANGTAGRISKIVQTTMRFNPSDTPCARIGEGCRPDRVLSVGATWMTKDQLSVSIFREAVGSLGKVTAIR